MLLGWSRFPSVVVKESVQHPFRHSVRPEDEGSECERGVVSVSMERPLTETSGNLSNTFSRVPC